MTRKFLPLVLIALTVVVLPTIVWAGFNFKFRGDTADAFFYSEDSSGIQTYASVWVSDGVVQSPPGRPGTSSQVYVSIYRVDPNASCGPDFCPPPLLDAFGSASLEDSAFRTIKKLTSASLTATEVYVYDYVSGNSFPVAIDLHWDGTGVLQQESSRFTSKYPGCQIKSSYSGSYRFAEATGSISDGSTEYTQGEPSEYANIYSVKQGDMAIGCNG